jgi:hypothetical protein
LFDGGAWRAALAQLAEARHLAEGEVLLAAGDAAVAEASYRQAIAPEPCGLLAPVYGWLTEGFNTADLKEAKALLLELA